MAVRGSLLLLLGAAAGARAGTVEVLHDNWGVPHIYASDDAAMAFGYGYSTAEDHGELCLSLYAGARCRAQVRPRTRTSPRTSARRRSSQTSCVSEQYA